MLTVWDFERITRILTDFKLPLTNYRAMNGDTTVMDVRIQVALSAVGVVGGLN